MIKITTIVLVGVLALLPSTGALAWGAIAIGPNGAIGHAYDYPTAEEAQAEAVTRCGTSCAVRDTFQASCLASVFKQSGASAEFEWEFGSDLAVLAGVADRLCREADLEGWQRCVTAVQFCSR